MIGFRLLAYALLAYSAFWVAAYRGLWYDSHVFARKSSAFEFKVGDFFVSGERLGVVLQSFAASAGMCFFCPGAMYNEYQNR